jgi:hypothetical protein
MSCASAQDSAEKARRTMAGYVAEDVREFLAAAARGFESYKTGEATDRADGIRSWDSSRKPALAQHCEIQEHGSAKSYFCTLYASAYKGELEVQYKDLISDVVDALPAGWTQTAEAPFGVVVDSAGFVSSDGTNGQIWIAFDPSQNNYSLYFQIVAPNGVAAETEKPVDDPIGGGGFITPPPGYKQ